MADLAEFEDLVEEIEEEDVSHIDVGDEGILASTAGGHLDELAQDVEDEDEEYEEIMGHVIEGDTGEFYVVTEDDGQDDDFEMDNIRHITMAREDDGTATLVLECDATEQQEPDTKPPPRRPRQRARVTVGTGDDGEPFEVYRVIGDEEENDRELAGMDVGALQTAEEGDEHAMAVYGEEQFRPMFGKSTMRRNRVFGGAKCSECGQCFLNTARLERHLSVHQIFGSFLCPLCGKTYKYEYNLFYHWRRTCRDLNDLISQDERKDMDVNALRSLVDDVAQKKAEYGPIEIGISRSVLFQSGPLARLEMPSNPLGRRGTSCRACGIVVHQQHIARHMALHKGDRDVRPDDRTAVGGFHCDLCGLMFRQHANLIKHWRSSCNEIQANLPDDCELTLDDGQLKAMVMSLLRKAATNSDAVEIEARKRKEMERARAADQMNFPSSLPAAIADKIKRDLFPRESPSVDVAGGGVAVDGGAEDMDEMGGGMGLGRDPSSSLMPESVRRHRNMDDGWTDDQGAVFADDFDDDELLMLNNQSAAMQEQDANKDKWNMEGGPVQCTECFRTFANAGRLERHMAGFHASFGSHHCALCGNRFKYDYNLLYHYRRSCPYTKAYIDRDVREQMDAASLRKYVRRLAQNDVKLAPRVEPIRPTMRQTRVLAQNNDAIVRREMMKEKFMMNPPATLVSARPNINGEPKHCPVCGVVFYSMNAVQKHVSVMHGGSYESYYMEEEDEEVTYVEEEVDVGHHTVMTKDGRGMRREEIVVEEVEVEDDEPPPLLEVQLPGGEEPTSKPSASTEPAIRSITKEGTMIYVEGLGDGDDEDAQIREMMNGGEVDVQPGDTIVIVRESGNMEFSIGPMDGEVVEEDVEGVPGRGGEDRFEAPPLRPLTGIGTRQPSRGVPALPPPSGGGRIEPPAKRHRPIERSIWDADPLDEEMALGTRTTGQLPRSRGIMRRV